MKKLLSTLLCLVFVISLLPLSAVPARAATVASGSCGANLTWSLDDTGLLTIRGAGAMTDFSSTESVPWYENRSAITSVVMESGATSIGSWAFCDYHELTGVTIGSGVTSIGQRAFDGCSSLTNVTIPSGVTSIGGYAFYACTGLKSVMLGRGVAEIGRFAFSSCYSLIEINVASDNKTYCGDDGVLFSKDRTVLLFYPGGRAGSYAVPSGVKRIEDSAFFGSLGITDLTFPDSVTYIGEEAVSSCFNLTGITIPDSVTTIGASAFFNDPGLTSMTIGSGVTSIGDFAFAMSSGLTEINVAAGNKAYCSAEGVLFNKNKTALVACPGGRKGVYAIPTGVISIGNGAFSNCESLTGVTIPASVSEIGTLAFYGCNGLTSITVPASVTRFDDRVFEQCHSLTKVILGSGVSVIGYGTFFCCYSLKTVTIPVSVTVIAAGSFECCDALTDIWYGGTQQQWNAIDIGNCNDPLLNAAIHYNSASPIITSQPSNAMVAAGGTAKFTVAATGTGALTYQWQYSTNGSTWYSTSLTGCNTATLSVTAGAAVNGRFYRCVLSDSRGSVASNAAKLTVIPGPAITKQPQDQAVTVGSKATFTVTAVGTGTLTYRWQWSADGKSWANTSLTGYNTASLTVTASSAVNGRYYRCVVRDSQGSATSDAAKLTVVSGPTITAQPKNRSAGIGNKAYFTLTATGTGALTYQWQYSTSGTTWYNTSLTGYNTPTLTVTASSAVNGRYYRCVVSDDMGSVNSAAAKLFVTSPGITSQPKSVTVSSGSKAAFTVTAMGTGTLTYQWQYSTNGTNWYNTSLTGYNTATLTVTASSAVNGRYYRCVISDSKGSVTSSAAKLTVTPGPTITAQPQNQTVTAGSKALFTVTATGSGTLTYQWQYSTNGTTWYDTALTGCSTPTLTVVGSSAVNGRYYRCVVTGSGGTATSNAAKLTVLVEG